MRSRIVTLFVNVRVLCDFMVVLARKQGQCIGIFLKILELEFVNFVVTVFVKIQKYRSPTFFNFFVPLGIRL